MKIHEISTANIILNVEKLKAFSLTSEKNTRKCIFITVTQYYIESSTQNNAARKGTKSIQIRNQEVKLPRVEKSE